MKTVNSSRQHGLSMLGIVIVLLLTTFFLTIVFKVGPIYLDDLSVKGAFEGLQRDNVRDMSDSDIRRKLDNYFTVNNVRNIRARDVKIKRERTRILVSYDYEVRAEFLGNLDVVVRFKHGYDSSEN